MCWPINTQRSVRVYRPVYIPVPGFREVSAVPLTQNRGEVMSSVIGGGYRRGAALCAGFVLTVGLLSAAPSATTVAEAASSWGCSKWITTYSGFLGVTIYRGHMTCWGNVPGNQYRNKITCTLNGGYYNHTEGAWKKQGSGDDSYSSCPWP